VHSLRGIAILSLGAGALVGLAGAGVLRLLRGRSIIVHIVALITITVAVVVAGVVAVARAMFLSDHDLTVVLITVGVAALVSLVVGVTFGRRLAAAAMWARQAEQGRRELVAWVSHDLRTPLAGLRAMSEALEDGVVADPDAVAEYHRRIRAETERMSGLVDDLFELSRIHAGALQLHMAEVPLAEVVSDAIASVKPLAASKGIVVDAPEQGWPVVSASESELARVVANLRAACDWSGLPAPHRAPRTEPPGPSPWTEPPGPSPLDLATAQTGRCGRGQVGQGGGDAGQASARAATAAGVTTAFDARAALAGRLGRQVARDAGRLAQAAHADRRRHDHAVARRRPEPGERLPADRPVGVGRDPAAVEAADQHRLQGRGRPTPAGERFGKRSSPESRATYQITPASRNTSRLGVTRRLGTPRSRSYAPRPRTIAAVLKALAGRPDDAATDTVRQIWAAGRPVRGLTM
jgi:phospho-acceptor domain-containing protein